VCCREPRRGGGIQRRGSGGEGSGSVLQCVEVCCSVLQGDPEGRRDQTARERGGRFQQCVAVSCRVLQCVAVCCRETRRGKWIKRRGSGGEGHGNTVECSRVVNAMHCLSRDSCRQDVLVLQMCCHALQCVEVCCSGLQRAAVPKQWICRASLVTSMSWGV